MTMEFSFKALRKRNFLRTKGKAFSVDDIPSIVLGVGVSAIIGGIVILILGGMQNSSAVSVCTNGGSWNGIACSNGGTNTLILSQSYNALGNGILGIGNIFTQYPLLGTVVGLMLILGVVLFFFYGRGSKEGL